MYTEVPVLRRCCCCIPLRYGLIGWGYIKLILSFLTLLWFFMPFIRLIMSLSMYRNYYIYQDLAIITIIILMLIVDIVIHVIFIVGAHKKNVNLLEVFYYYSLSLLILLCVLSLVNIGMTISRRYFLHLLDIMGRASILSLDLVLQTYIILLVRSEIIKLKDSASCRFVNNAADAECILNVKDPNEEKVSFDDDTIDLIKDSYGNPPVTII